MEDLITSLVEETLGLAISIESIILEDMGDCLF